MSGCCICFSACHDLCTVRYAHCRTIGFVRGLSSSCNEEVLGKSKVFAFERM